MAKSEMLTETAKLSRALPLCIPINKGQVSVSFRHWDGWIAASHGGFSLHLPNDSDEYLFMCLFAMYRAPLSKCLNLFPTFKDGCCLIYVSAPDS